jgi:hypothetical protein
MDIGAARLTAKRMDLHEQSTESAFSKRSAAAMPTRSEIGVGVIKPAR